MTTPQALFSETEAAEWEDRKKDAEKWRPDDDVVRPEGPNPYNKSVYARRAAVSKAYYVERLQRVAARPDELVNMLLVAFYERGSASITWEEAFDGGLKDRLGPADTPEVRRHTHTILSGLRTVPQSWAKSATTRFFRGTGKQGKPPWSKRAGAGVLGKHYGWKQYEATWFIELFYSWPLNDLFFSDDSPDCYGEEADEIREEGGNQFAATRKERDDDSFDTLLSILEKRGLADDIQKPKVKKPKPRNPKVFKPGDRITSRNVRDLPAGSHFRWTVHRKDWSGKDRKNKITRHRTYEGAYLERVKPGGYVVKPVMDGHCFSPMRHKSGSVILEDAEFIGTWDGPEVNVAPEKWEPVKATHTKGWDEGADWES